MSDTTKHPTECVVTKQTKADKKQPLNQALRANLARRKSSPKDGLHRPLKRHDDVT